MHLNDLIKTCRNMTDDELKEAIIAVRRSRLTPKATSQKAKSATKTKERQATKKQESIEDLLGQLTPDQIKELVAGLGD